MIGIEQIAANAKREEERIAHNMKIVRRHKRKIYQMFQQGASVYNLAGLYSVRHDGIEGILREGINGWKRVKP